MWKKYINEILFELNQIQSLPSHGILAGGSLANKIWEKVSGNKAVINDIDIFEYKSIVDISYDEVNEIKIDPQTGRLIENKNNPDYGYSEVLYQNDNTRTFYRIISCQRQNMINLIDLESNTNNPQNIIDGFDINCTQVAYDLNTKKLYYTQEFDKFIQQGVLKIVNGNTPSHTFLRILSKRDQLNVKFDIDREFSFLSASRFCKIKSGIRYNFSEKYLIPMQKYFNEIVSYGFFIRQKEHKNKVWCITPNNNNKYIHNVPKDSITTIGGLNYYFNNIYGNNELEKLWRHIGYFWQIGDGYLSDYTIHDLKKMENQIKSLNKWVEKIEMLKKSLFGLNIKEQFKSLVLLKRYLMINPGKLEIFKFGEQKLNFDNLDDVYEYVNIVQIIKRFEIQNSRNKKDDIDIFFF